jgi:hypothetical protein
MNAHCPSAGPTMKSTYSWIFAGASILILTMAPAVYCGSHTSRWGNSVQLQRAAAALDSVPLHIGPWTCSESAPLADTAKQLLKYDASLNRTYANRDDSTTVQCILLVGLPGPIVRHPPELCYEVRDDEVLDQRVVEFKSGDADDSIRLTRFRHPGTLRGEFYVATGWYAHGRLRTTNSPRMTYGGEPFIHAIQIMWPIIGDPQSAEEVGIGFLQAFLPVFRELSLKTENAAA